MISEQEFTDSIKHSIQVLVDKLQRLEMEKAAGVLNNLREHEISEIKRCIKIGEGLIKESK